MPPKVAIAQINSTVGDLSGNRERIGRFARMAAEKGADIVLTPELSLTGYPPEDLLLQKSFHSATQLELDRLKNDLADLDGVHVLVGHHTIRDGLCYNACSILVNGSVIGTYFKQELPNYTVFDEKRYFTPGKEPLVFNVGGVRFGVAICEDIWFSEPPVRARDAGADVLLVMNSSPYHMGKMHQRPVIVRENVIRHGMAAVYANLVGGQDELVFDGCSFVMNRAGKVCVQMKQCEEDLEIVSFEHGDPVNGRIEASLSVENEVYRVLVSGVRDYVNKNGFPGVIIGLSGGVDSALVLAIAVDALGPEKVHAVMMPSPYTSDISRIDASEMAARLNVNYDEIPISACFSAFLETLSPHFANLPEDTTEENLQARIRGTLLMALSNKFGSIVLTTGNKSEMAVGYCTLYGDMAGGFAVIKDIYKTLVYRLCRYRNTLSAVIPDRMLTRAPSAELKPNQFDQDTLPPYEVLDAIVKMFMEENKSVNEIVANGYSHVLVERIVRLMRINEYKRRQAPVGIRITPRGFGRDWRCPITSKYRD